MEQRQSVREAGVVGGVSSFIALPDGRELEGIVRDISEGGVKISGKTDGLSNGYDVELTVVVMGDQRVGCQAEVRHVEEDGYGLEFRGPLEPCHKEVVPMCCDCHREYPKDFKYCGLCGMKLNA
jgi:c-di-GMP-binding flagellar brake protein YcgR